MLSQVIEEIQAHRLGRLEKECTTCLLYGGCAVFKAMEEEEEGDIYDALAPCGECKVKERLDNVPDKQIGDYYLLRHWKD